MEMKLAQVQLPAATSSSLKIDGKLIYESASNPKEGGRDYYCDVCRVSLRNIREFVDHQIYHVHERAAFRKDRQRLKAKQYSCQFCIQKFDTRSLLNEHQKAHKHEDTLPSQTAITDGGPKSSSSTPNLVMAAPPPSHVLRGLIKKNLGVQQQSMIHKPSYQPKSHAVFGNIVPMMPRPTPEENRKLAGGVTIFNTETVFKVSAQYVSAALRFKHEPNHSAAASCPTRTTKKDHLVGNQNQQYEDVDLTLKL